MSEVKNKAFIYGLIDPRTRTVRYVGGSDDPDRRLVDHHYDTKGKPNRKKLWFLEMRRLDISPELVILERVSPGESWRVREAAWRTYFAKSDLVNGDPGIKRAAWRR